jgi:glycosyltransferase involved in cell wall biosynthesis
LFNCRIAWSFHNIESHEKLHPRLERWVQRRFARQCAWIRVMYHSSAGRAIKYLGVPAEKIRVVPMGPYSDCYSNTISRADARRALALDSSHRVLLNIGVMRRYKGILELISAVREIDDPRLRVVVAGPCHTPRFAEELRRAAALEPRVVLMMEFVPDDRLQLLLNAADAVILPFHRIENSSSVLLAMTFAKPVIAPAQGVLPEQLVQQAHLLYGAGGLRNAIVAFLSADAKELEKAGRQNQAASSQTRWSDFAEVFRERRQPGPIG